MIGCHPLIYYIASAPPLIILKWFMCLFFTRYVRIELKQNAETCQKCPQVQLRPASRIERQTTTKHRDSVTV